MQFISKVSLNRTKTFFNMSSDTEPYSDTSSTVSSDDEVNVDMYEAYNDDVGYYNETALPNVFFRGSEVREVLWTVMNQLTRLGIMWGDAELDLDEDIRILDKKMRPNLSANSLNELVEKMNRLVYKRNEIRVKSDKVLSFVDKLSRSMVNDIGPLLQDCSIML